MNAQRELPDGWRWVRFGDGVRQVKETTKDPDSIGLTRVVGLEHLDSESLPVRRWNELVDLPDGTSFTRIFRAGQVLFGKRRAYQRKVGVADFDGICSGDILVLESSTDELLPEFLPYLVQSDGFFDHALGTSAGSLSPRTRWQELAKYEFALPPLLRQEEVVEALTAGRSTVESYESVVAAAEQLLASLRRDLIDADADGPTLPLGEVAAYAMGRVYPSGDYTDQGLPLLRPGNIAPSGRLDWSPASTVHLPERYKHERGSVSLRPGEIVMNMTAQSLEDGFLGRVCYSTPGDESLVNQRIAMLRSVLGSSEYLFRVLQHPRFRAHIAASAKGSKIKHLYWRDLEVFQVPVPGAARESAVVAGLDRAEALMRSALRAVVTARSLLKSLGEQLLQGAADV